MPISVWCVFIAILLLASSFILYPLLLFVSQFFVRTVPFLTTTADKPTSVSFIVVVHNAEHLITDKLKNILQLDYDGVQYEILVYLDGCSDKTLERIEGLNSNRIQLINEQQHLGKIAGLNKAASLAKGEILIFTDADAILDNNVVNVFLTQFKDPRCGGVCGLRTIREKQGKMRLAQHLYISVDSYIKTLENALGNITSNDGKLYAVRRSLFKPIADAVTDDLFSCLTITAQHYRFIFEPKAVAHISTPSRSGQHETSRRRRIVTRSLNGIFIQRKLLNPFNYGLFSLGLVINKIFRRLFAAALIMLFIASYFARDFSILIESLFYVQLGFYLLAIAYPLYLSRLNTSRMKLLSYLASIFWYFCLGNYATLLGVIDFLSGKRVSKWIPQKHN